MSVFMEYCHNNPKKLNVKAAKTAKQKKRTARDKKAHGLSRNRPEATKHPPQEEIVSHGQSY